MIWKPIATVPKDGRMVLLYTYAGITSAVWSNLYNCWTQLPCYAYDGDSADITGEPTHWADYPEPPCEQPS